VSIYKMKSDDVEMTGTLPELAMASGDPLGTLEKHLAGARLKGITLRKYDESEKPAGEFIPQYFCDDWTKVTTDIRKRVKWVKSGGRKIVLPHR
jgi:hypothetical protein